MTTSTSDPRDPIRRRAADLGFDVCRFTGIGASWPATARLQAFLQAGRHGDMEWMAATAERRGHPLALWPQARSAVVLGLNYGPETNPLDGLALRDRGLLSVYARGDDYHEVLKGRLKQLGGWMAARLGGDLKVFVDTAPLMEKPLAQQAGLGWQGKHTNLVSRDFGSWLFLGVILTTADLPPDPEETDHCGQCRACLEACPTAAFPAPYQLDARRCVSYLTIEHKGPVDPDLRPGLGNRIYGCDDCLAVCPWNKFARAGREQRLAARDDLAAPPLAELAALDETAFRARFARSPVKRTGRDRFLRNVLYAIGNSDNPALVPAAKARLDDASPLVRGAAVWALGRLLPRPELLELARAHAGAETDPDVRVEWERVQSA
ncbi:MAG: tRNA epoxyqueuosine(34) reductase QueG [Phenylobacterium sp.]|uniref:tRNA epoxyqueuosine(34) reductase QueG n=2 Tax=Phenylobacterium sp. TaxID=1871053 RepID=UPI0025F1DA15|nr:tRNA epoxyqueuosine(34) reductase QueG [Phenylobacterium sp.]MCA6223587.1 tRNA epoxyqueuosine(34) reductase QueG [Phenylobacterium sp.]MCA6230923.1 tRNA epoxyqueuosine(34) reductase QueG [Phenylobacterium sp.]MCA6250846.1 tRNA epoxyqueuosine(34) reductase QueG [Phenylobacterium sp.]MCA6257969.1 tRNA epoxyqueuosine(34) reductase QueG [Phenylobacterium sp.]MCA6265799.1 tRNA epoxyqueuosine(34) reductase QueG [Phenylobacterium sp.]